MAEQKLTTEARAEPAKGVIDDDRVAVFGLSGTPDDGTDANRGESIQDAPSTAIRSGGAARRGLDSAIGDALIVVARDDLEAFWIPSMSKVGPV